MWVASSYFVIYLSASVFFFFLNIYNHSVLLCWFSLNHVFISYLSASFFFLVNFLLSCTFMGWFSLNHGFIIEFFVGLKLIASIFFSCSRLASNIHWRHCLNALDLWKGGRHWIWISWSYKTMYSYSFCRSARGSILGFLKHAHWSNDASTYTA